MVSEFQPMLAEKSMTCHLALPDKLSCSCDPDKLARVFDNLLRNACHYGLPGTDIRIAGEIDGGRAVLTFSNAGRTIPQEKLERIFEQFFRLDKMCIRDRARAHSAPVRYRHPIMTKTRSSPE